MSGTFSRLKRKVGFLSRCLKGKGPHHTLRGESLGIFRVAAGNLGFLSSYDWDFRDPLVLPQECPVSMRVVRGLSGFLSSRCQVLDPPVELRQEPKCSPPTPAWILGFLLKFHGKVRHRLVWRHASPLSSRALKVVSGFLWS